MMRGSGGLLAGFVPSQVDSLVCAGFPQALVFRKLPGHTACFLSKTSQAAKMLVTTTGGSNFQMSGLFFPLLPGYIPESPRSGAGAGSWAALSLGPRGLGLDLEESLVEPGRCWER